MMRRTSTIWTAWAVILPLLLINCTYEGTITARAFVPAPVSRQRLSVGPSSLDTWQTTAPRLATTSIKDSNRWDREIEENSRRRASSGSGETIAGAVLGGLLGGPFGAMFGASIGSSFGAKNAVNRARQQEMERLGITPDMLEAARDCGTALERTNEGLRAVQDSLQTQQSLARRLDREATELYERAKSAMAASNEEEARTILLKRQQVQDKLKQVLKQCAEEKKRVETMERNAQVLEQRAMEIESLLQRTVGAKAMQDTSDMGSLSLSTQDPLLQKFRDLGID